MSDRGGGVPFRKIEKLFSYMYSTAPRPNIGDHQRAPLVSVRQTQIQEHKTHSQYTNAHKQYTHTRNACTARRHTHGHTCTVMSRITHMLLLISIYSIFSPGQSNPAA